jgi:hypothetical protein
VRGAVDHLRAGLGGAQQRTALALEQPETELVLELLELFAHAGLRGVQRAGGLRDVEIVFGDRDEISQLDEFHRGGNWWAIGRSECEIRRGGTTFQRTHFPRGPGRKLRASLRVVN